MIVSFISQKGGVGKSILSQALAAEATRAGIKTLLFDYDPKQATSKTVWWEERRNNKIEPSIAALASDNLETSKFLNYDLIVIDGPANTTKSTINVALHSDLVFQPTSPTKADTETATLEFNTLVNHGVDPQKMFLVFNQVLTNAQEKRARKRLAEKYPHYQIVEGSIPTKVTYANAQDEGFTITEINPGFLLQKAKDLVYAVMRELVNKRKEIKEAQRYEQKE